MSAPEESPRRRERLRWNGILTTLGVLIALVLVLYFSIYLPDWIVSLPWQVFVFAGFIFYITLIVLLPMFAIAVLGSKTGILATQDGVWRISEVSKVELDPIATKLDYDKLEASGIELPTSLKGMLTELPQPGTDEKGRPIAAWYYKSGGYRLSKVWYDEPGADGFHIAIGQPFFDLGGKRRGGCLMSPCKPVAVPHEGLPERWLQQLREDHMFKDDDPAGTGSAVWVHVEPSQGFLEGVRRMAEVLRPYIESAPESLTGRMSVSAAWALVVQSEVKYNRLKAEYDEVWQRNLELTKASRGEAAARSAVYSTPDRRPAGYGATDRVPSGSASVE